MKGDGPLRRVRRAVSARAVYGKPIERDGVTLVPAAYVVGGGGGGGGGGADSDGEDGEGSGGGFGLLAFPIGAYEITDEEVRWHPVVDLRFLLGAFVLLAALKALIKALR